MASAASVARLGASFGLALSGRYVALCAEDPAEGPEMASDPGMERVRYVAYSSDVGEGLRPVLKPWMVHTTYGVAIGYVVYDSGCAAYEKKVAGHPNEVLAATMMHRLTFHALLSLALPALIIHGAVHHSTHLFARAMFEATPTIRRFGPSVIGLSIIPFLPLMDEPAEHLLGRAFDALWPAWRVGEKKTHDD